MKPTPKGPADDLPVMEFATSAAFEHWLQSQPDAKGVWLKIGKKGQDAVTLSVAEALDVCLCHGWIDGQRRALDDSYFLQRFVPRRPKGLWSKLNIGNVERLIQAGRMREGGQREIDAAKADGRWDAAYAPASAMGVPEDLARALDREPKARAFFDALDKTNRYAVLWRVETAKKAQTRASRIEKFVAMLARGEKIHQ